VQSNEQATDIFTKVLPKPLFENYKKIFRMMNERDLSLRNDVGNNKLQVPIPKNQEFGKPTTSTTHMPKPRRE
jgi:hypothetical protein